MERPEAYDEFWDDYKQEGFAYCAEKYAGYKIKGPGPQPADSSSEGQKESILIRLWKKLSGKEG